MRKLLSVMLMVIFILSLAGCKTSSDTAQVKTGSEAETKAEEDTVVSEVSSDTTEVKTKTIVDHEGTEMEIPTEINRIVIVTWPISAQIPVYLGGAEKVVGISPQAMTAAENGLLGQIYPEILNASTKFYEGGTINVEELLLLEPDIVIGASGEAAESIRAAGIPVVAVSTSKWGGDVVATTEGWLDLFQQIFGESETANKVKEYMRKTEADISAKVASLSEEERKKVLFLFGYSDATMSTSSKNFYGQSWCDHIGAIHAGKDIEEGTSVEINMEQVYEWNPDVILITNFTTALPEDLYNNAIGNDDWSTVNAVKNKEVYKMPLGMYRAYTAGVDVPITLQWAAKSVYPQLFEDVDMKQVTKEYFRDCFSIELTDEQVEKIFNPPREASANY